MLHPQVPVHTISFNCADKEANEFLYQLAKETGGRYHYYNEDGIMLDGPEPWEVSCIIIGMPSFLVIFCQPARSSSN